MKKITLLLSGICLILGAKAQTFSDGFEADTVGKLGPQSPVWTTWTKADGGPEDVMVIDSANHTPGGSKSIYFVSDQPSGGPTDVILPISSVPLTSGSFTFTSWFKIPTDKSAYFNFQGDTIPGDIFTFECNLDAGGFVTISNGSQDLLTTTHPFDTWFKLTIDVNLNINSWSLSINDTVRGKWKNAVAQIAAVDFYPSNSESRFFVDDVYFKITPYVLPAVNGSASAAAVQSGLVGQQRKLSFTARNFGKANITSFDVSVSHNGATPIKETVTGVNIPSYESKTVVLNALFTLVEDENTFTAIIGNVNGAGVDGEAIDDTTSTVSIGTKPAAGKLIFVEDVTGTWCGSCPLSKVFTAKVASDYKGYFAGVAAHLENDVNTDTMALKGYANFLEVDANATRNIVIDRNFVVGGRGLENLFFQQIVKAPEGLLVNGAEFNSTTRELKVSITTTLQNDILGDYRVACVLTEDSVSGTTTAFDQANDFAGGKLGVMGGYELLPNPVPAAKMNYDNVARAFSPTPEGYPDAYGASATKGQKITHNFIYTIPATWDINQFHIIGVMIKPNTTVTNASYTSLKDAIKNGYVTGTVVGVDQLTASADAILLAPNPTNDFSVISLNLKAESTVSVDVYNIAGALVESKAYGKLNGAYHLPVEASKLVSGMYFIRVNVNNQPTVLKLIKE